MPNVASINACPEIRRFQLSDLHPLEDNPRVISDEALAGLSRSLETYGCVELIVVNVWQGLNRIVGGHQRYKVLLAKGVQECMAVVVDIPPAQERLLNVALNNPNIQGQFSDSLATFIDGLRHDLGDDSFLLGDLLVDDLAPVDLGESLEKPRPQQQSLEPYQRTHVLLSFPPEVLSQIGDLLEQIRQCPGVEYEQSSN
jgi:ParB-like chromosome segregation protein Spo0J